MFEYNSQHLQKLPRIVDYVYYRETLKIPANNVIYSYLIFGRPDQSWTFS